MANWYNENAHIAYPFQSNPDATALPKSAIVDCRFFIVNPESEDFSVFLYEFTDENNQVSYTFKAKSGNSVQSITFTATKSNNWQCIWNTDNPNLYGFIVISGTDVA